MKSYLWVADPRQVPFLCSCKEKEPKESTPRSARRFTRRSGPLRSSPHRALAQLAGRTLRASGSNTVSLKNSRCGCGTRRALRGLEQHLALPDFYSGDLAGFVGSVNTAWPCRLMTKCLLANYLWSSDPAKLDVAGPGYTSECDV
jgi:hypothetical protein